MLRSSKALLLLSLATLLVFASFSGMWAPKANAQESTPSPTIQSDKADYRPGETVVLTGNNWQPGESVNIWVNDDEGQTWSRNVDLEADSNGGIRDEFELPDWFVATYNVTATGAQSGVVKTSFTDGNVAFSATSPAPSSWTAHYTVYDNSACTTGANPQQLSVSGQGPSLNGTVPGNKFFKLNNPTTTDSSYTFDGWDVGSSSTCYSGSGNNTFTAKFKSTKQNQTITFGTLANKTYGDAPFTVSATASSGLPVSFTASGTCTVSGSTVTITGAGSCSITATQAGNATYNPAPDVTRSFDITKANQTISFASDTPTSKTYGDAPFTVSATASSGLSVSYAAKSGSTCTVSGSTVTITGAGDCTIVASQAGNGNYNAATDVEKTITINKATPTITWNNPADITYGTALSGTQLNAAANVPGSFTYSPDSGTVLNAGNGQVLTANFTPTDTTNYSTPNPKTVSINVLKANQTIDFAELEDATYGDDPISLSATASSGLPVSFTADGNCELDEDGTTLSITGVGTCEVTASQEGDSNYNAAQPVSHSFSIEKATATIQLGNLSQTYDGSPKPVSIVTDPENLTVDVTYDGSATPPTNAGSYAVVAEVDDDNYEGTANGTLVIAKANQTITFDTLANKTYGDEPFELEATASSGLPVSFAASSESDCTVSGSTVTITGAGSCTITASQAGNDNYNPATNVDRTFTIGKANQTITFDALSEKSFGDAPFTVSATGGDSGNPVTFTADGDCTVSDSTVTITGAGSCTITASQAGNDDYEAAEDVPQAFTINKAQATVELSGLSHTYNGQPKSASASTTPSGLNVSITYNGSSTAPTDAGSYTVVAEVNDDNYEGSESGTLVIAKADQTIDFDELADATYGDEPISLSATASSGLPVSFTADGNCELDEDGTTLSITAAGICEVTAFQAGDSNYNAATPVPQSFQIAKAQATIELDNLSHIYDGSVKAATVKTNPEGLSGVTISYFNTDSSGNKTGSALQSAPTNAGKYVVEAALDNANYQAQKATGTLEIAKADGSVSINNIPSTATFGGSFTPTYTQAGDGTASTASNTPSVCSVSSQGVVSFEAAGTCKLQASVTEGTNHRAATGNEQSFTVSRANQAALTVTQPNSGTYGDKLEMAASGGTTNEAVTFNVVAGSTACQIDANNKLDIKSGTGTCKITATRAGNANYNPVTSAEHTVTVAKRQANVVYTGENYKAIASAGNATINLSAQVSRTSGNLGDLSLANVEFTVKKYNGAVQTTVNKIADANGNAATTASVPTSDDPYTVEVRIAPANVYWTSGIDVGSLQVIVGSGTGRTAGGGWIPDATNTINGKSNFGFTVQNSKSGIKGNSLFIYRAHEGSNEVQYVVKSNSWQGGGLTFNVNNDAAKATFTGKATVQRYVNGVLDTAFSGGNHTFTVDDFDGDLKNPKQKDSYAITVRNSANQIVKQLGSRTTPVTLGGGNVLVQKK